LSREVMENEDKKLLPQNIDHLIIDSGNLLTLEVLKRKASILPTEEVLIFRFKLILINLYFICFVINR
jgi:hypothetical protein